jgi:hypothetical protein
MVALCATWRFTTKSAPDEIPEIVTVLELMFSKGSGTGSIVETAAAATMVKFVESISVILKVNDSFTSCNIPFIG